MGWRFQTVELAVDLGQGQGLELSSQLALMPRGFILMNDIFIGDSVDDAHRGTEHRLGRSLVASLDGFASVLDRRAQLRALAHIVSTPMLRLFRRLACAISIRHSPRCLKIKAGIVMVRSLKSNTWNTHLEATISPPS
jgi:hypothetical protein